MRDKNFYYRYEDSWDTSQFDIFKYVADTLKDIIIYDMMLNNTIMCGGLIMPPAWNVDKNVSLEKRTWSYLDSFNTIPLQQKEFLNKFQQRNFEIKIAKALPIL